MKLKNKKGLWLSLFVLLVIGALTAIAYGRIAFPATPAAVLPPDPLGLGFQANCITCHRESMPDSTYYCHGISPIEDYNFFNYFSVHLTWISQSVNMPPALYLPPVATPNQVQDHIFALSLLPVSSNIKVGTTVTWTDLETQPCTLISNVAPPAGPFDRIIIMPGQSFSYTYTKPGSFIYRVQTGSSADSNMVGTITVS